jgi:hypothetical protein
MVFKGAGVVGVFTFGQVRAMGGGSEPNDFAALLLLAGFFVAGFFGTLTVRETRGVRAAKRSEREWAGAMEAAAEAQVRGRG